MATPSREVIYGALFNLLKPLLAPGAVDGPPDGSVGAGGVQAKGGTPTANQPFNLVSREVIEVQRVPPGLQPVLMQYEFNEENVSEAGTLVKKKYTVVLIIGATHPKGTPGATVLNPIIDLVENVINSIDDEDPLGMGGRVTRVQLQGTGGKDHGDNSTKTDQRQAAYYLPIEIILPVS